MRRLFRSVLSLILVLSLLGSMSMAAFASTEETTQPTAAVEQTPAPAQTEPPAPPETEAPPAPETEPAPAQTEPKETQAETTAPEETETADQDDPTLKRYTWRHPITKKLYTNLTWEEYQKLLEAWKKEKEALRAAGVEIPGEDDDDTYQEPAPVETEPAETVEVTVPAETVAGTEPVETTVETVPQETEPQHTEPQETEPAGYYVDYYAGDKVVKVRGDSGISVTELLTQLGVEIPEGAEIALDPDSVDTRNLTVTEVDGELVLTSNGTFFETDRDLVVLINGVPTTIQVKDPETAANLIGRTEGKDDVVLKDSVEIQKGSGAVTYDSGTTVIDLNGKTIYGDKDADYAFVVGGGSGSDKVSVTFMNGSIVAAQNAVKAVGNAVVNFINMTVKAAGEALHMDTDGNASGVTTQANMDDASVLMNTDKTSASDTVFIEGGNADLYVGGTVVNKGTGYAINGDDAAKDSDIMLDYHARLYAAGGEELNDDKLGEPDSGGARFAHEKDLDDSFPLVLDLNFDTDYRFQGISSKEMMPTTNPTREGYSFVGWNTCADGSGRYVTRSFALKYNITKLYAIWQKNPTGPADYAWLVRGTVEGTNDRTYFAQTRMSISKKIAHIYFQSGSSQHLSPVKVEFRNVQSLKNMGAEYARVQLDSNLYLEIDLDELVERGEKTADGKKVNTFVLERDKEDMITVTSGETDVFCFNAAEFAKATKNDLILCFERGGLTVYYGKDEICDTKLPEGQFSKVKLDTKEKELSISKAEPRKK